MDEMAEPSWITVLLEILDASPVRLAQRLALLPDNQIQQATPEHTAVCKQAQHVSTTHSQRAGEMLPLARTCRTPTPAAVVLQPCCIHAGTCWAGRYLGFEGLVFVGFFRVWLCAGIVGAEYDILHLRSVPDVCCATGHP